MTQKACVCGSWQTGQVAGSTAADKAGAESTETDRAGITWHGTESRAEDHVRERDSHMLVKKVTLSALYHLLFSILLSSPFFSPLFQTNLLNHFSMNKPNLSNHFQWRNIANERQEEMCQKADSFTRPILMVPNAACPDGWITEIHFW